MENKIPTQKEFLSLFPSTRFRYIHDVTGVTTQGNDVLDLSWNERGYGVFFTVNGFPPEGDAKIPNIISLNANFVDIDIEKGTLTQQERDATINNLLMKAIEDALPPPTIIVRTKNGVHIYWMYQTPVLTPNEGQLVLWRDIQDRLVRYFKGDSNARDPARILRVPYTNHLKDPSDPFRVTIHSYKLENVYDMNEINAAVSHYSKEKIEKEKIPAMEILLKGVPIGQGLRHGASAQIAGLLLKGANTPEKVASARQNFYNWDRKIVGSPERFEARKKELDDTFEGILRREATNITIVQTNKPRLWSIGDILTTDFGIEEWTVESLIPKQGMTALSGNPGDFKTWVTIHIALCLSRKGLVFGKFPAAQGAVLIIDEEDHIRGLKKRLSFLGAKDTDSIYYFSQSGIKVDMEDARNMILDIVKEKNITLVILDSLIRIHSQEENAAGGMAKVFSCFQDIIKAGASILFTHHHRKQQGFAPSNPGQNMRGSSDILAAVDSHITIEQKRDEVDLLIIKQTKLRQDEELKPFEVKVLKEALDDKGKACPSGFEYAGGHDEKKKKAEEVAEGVVLLLREGMKSRQEIQESLGDEFGKEAIDSGTKLAEESNSIERVPKEELPKENRKKAYYRLPIAPSTTITEKDKDLPASQPLIEARKQEDAKGIQKDFWDQATF